MIEDKNSLHAIIMDEAIKVAMKQFKADKHTATVFSDWWSLKIAQDFSKYSEYDLRQAWDEWNAEGRPLLDLFGGESESRG